MKKRNKRGARVQVLWLLRNIKSHPPTRILSRPKRSAAHVEMILSFVLFIFIVGFLLFYIRPYEKPVLANTLLSGLEDSFNEQASVDLTTLFLKVESDGCYVDLTGLGLDVGSNESGLLKSSGGNVVAGELIGNRLEGIGSGAFYLFVSSEFEERSVDCANDTEASYTAGSLIKKRIISNKFLILIKQRYDSEYASLKMDFGIPSNIDFSIVAGDVVMEMNVPEGLEVDAKSSYEDVLYSDGSIETQKFIFKVW